MRKILVIIAILLFIAVNAFGQWSGLTNGQIVSIANLQNAISVGIFTQLAEIYETPTNREIRKDSALSWVLADPTNSNLSPKTPNELVAKQDLTALSPAGCAVSTNVPYASTVYLNAGTTSYNPTLTITRTDGFGGVAYSTFQIFYNNHNIQQFTTYTTSDTTVGLTYTYNSSASHVLGIKFSSFGWESGDNIPTYTEAISCQQYYVYVTYNSAANYFVATVYSGSLGTGNIIDIPCQITVNVTYSYGGNSYTQAAFNINAGTSSGTSATLTEPSSAYFITVTGTPTTCNGTTVTIQHS